jgi:hypothetical protein
MGKRLLTTPKSRVKNALRQVWLRSRERAAAIKREEARCECCGAKQSVAKGREVKLEVHHKTGILNWDAILDAVYKYLLCDPGELQVLCKRCHDEHHSEEFE